MVILTVGVGDLWRWLLGPPVLGMACDVLGREGLLRGTWPSCYLAWTIKQPGIADTATRRVAPEG
jgi:hypothetical protein